MIVSSQLALKTHTNFGCAASLATLDKLVDRFPRPPVAPPIGDTSLTHVMRLAAHSTTSPMLTGMGQSFVSKQVINMSLLNKFKILFLIFAEKKMHFSFVILWNRLEFCIPYKGFFFHLASKLALESRLSVRF
jgi:hypothetical protein